MTSGAELSSEMLWSDAWIAGGRVILIPTLAITAIVYLVLAARTLKSLGGLHVWWLYAAVGLMSLVSLDDQIGWALVREAGNGGVLVDGWIERAMAALAGGPPHPATAKYLWAALSLAHVAPLAVLALGLSPRVNLIIVPSVLASLAALWIAATLWQAELRGLTF